MDSLPKKREIWLDEVDEQEFVKILSGFCKRECFLYVIIPDWEEELLNKLSTQFVRVKDVTLPRIFPRTLGYSGYVRDSQKQFVYEFYLRSSTMDLVFSEIDVAEHLQRIENKNIDMYSLFETNRISHITI